MKTKKFLMVTTAAAILAGGLLAVNSFAADSSATPAATPVRGQILRRLADRLNLTDDQKSQIKAIIAGEKDTLKNLLGQLHAARKDLRAAIQASDANETTVRAASAKMAAVEADLAVERMKIFAKISPVLTDEQRQQLSDLEQQADNLADTAIARIGDGVAQ